MRTMKPKQGQDESPVFCFCELRDTCIQKHRNTCIQKCIKNLDVSRLNNLKKILAFSQSYVIIKEKSFRRKQLWNISSFDTTPQANTTESPGRTSTAFLIPGSIPSSAPNGSKWELASASSKIFFRRETSKF